MVDWVDNAVSAGRQFLRSKDWIDYVRWQDVIQLDPQLDRNPTQKARIVADLVKWQNTDAGQEKFAELQEAQSRIPSGHRWTNGNYALANPEDTQHYHQDLRKVSARHTDPRKLFLYVAAATEEKFSTYDRYVNSGNYKHTEHILSMNPVKLGWENSVVPKIVSGRHQLAHQSFIEVMQHEVQHAIDYLNVKFAGANANVTKPRTSECQEVRAVAAERSLQKELGVPQRYAYHDIALDLQQTYVRGAKATPETYRNEVRELAPLAVEDVVGCTRESFSKAPAKGMVDVYLAVDQAMQNHGITIVEPPPRGRERK